MSLMSPRPNSLESIMAQDIAQNGPMDMGRFMGLALGHCEYGYYMSGDPFGRGGDFTTAPEISQMFGEILGAWFADIWMQMGSPQSFVFLECGPGRGTLMSDMMRATKSVPGFHAACEIHFLEMSPVLRDKQAQALKSYTPHWHETLGDVPRDKPLLVVGNEFFDALPVRQLEKVNKRWAERAVFYDEDKGFHLGLVPALPELIRFIPEVLRDAKEGSIFELSPVSRSFMRNLCDILKACGGAGLFIDYGPARSGLGDSVQAVRVHRYSDILKDIGKSDLTAHVDFESLLSEAMDAGADVWGIVEQGAFLKALGIEHRAAHLGITADANVLKSLKESLRRLVSCDQMGALFKVIGVSCGSTLRPAGF